jgi:DNA polymerase-3 subunit gamma/tau
LATTAPPKPAFSPFASDSSRKSFSEPAPVPPPPKVTPQPEVLVQTQPPPTPIVSIVETDPVSEISAVEVAAELLGMSSVPTATLEPEASPVTSSEERSEPATDAQQSVEGLQRIAIEALSAAKSQGSAADALADAEWTITGDELRVQTELSKTMLPMVINADADRIVRAALRSAGAAQWKLVLLPGSANTATAKKPRAAKTGSAQAKAMDHPVVQQAQRLFNAEIRNVIDLRDND